MALAAATRSKKAVTRVIPAFKVIKKTFNAANKALKASKAKKAIKAKIPPLYDEIVVSETPSRTVTPDEIDEISPPIKGLKVDLAELIA